MQNALTQLEEKYLLEIKEFYFPYFSSEESLDFFINRIFEFDWNDRKPRQMLFQVQRFVTLANDIDKIRPARDGLRILFIRCCMESLAKLSGKDPKEFFICFGSWFSDIGKRYILENFCLSYIEQESEQAEIDTVGKLTINDILCIIKEVRNMVVHEGNYWELQMFAHDDDSLWLTHIGTDQQLLSKETFENSEKQFLTYHFETKLQYEKFGFFFVEACIKFIDGYVDELSKNCDKKHS